jgi:hypothetical protein
MQVRAAGVIGLASAVAAGATAAYVTTAIPDKELRYVLASKTKHTHDAFPHDLPACLPQAGGRRWFSFASKGGEFRV